MGMCTNEWVNRYRWKWKATFVTAPLLPIDKYLYYPADDKKARSFLRSVITESNCAGWKARIRGERYDAPNTDSFKNYTANYPLWAKQDIVRAYRRVRRIPQDRLLRLIPKVVPSRIRLWYFHCGDTDDSFRCVACEPHDICVYVQDPAARSWFNVVAKRHGLRIVPEECLNRAIIGRWDLEPNARTGSYDLSTLGTRDASRVPTVTGWLKIGRRPRK